MSRALYEQELTELRDAVLAMGSMAEKAVLDAMESLRDGDEDWSRKIIEDDARINAKRFEIEDKTLFVIASQQPVATDLRVLASILYIVTDLERIADHAEGIAKINLMLADEALPRKLGYIPSMADRSIAMLRNSMRAFLTRDVDLARQICDADDEVDRLQDSVYAECFKTMIEDPTSVERQTYLLWTSHNLERIADRCTNICERVIYTVTGRMQEINVSKY
jgi:phosphate transport system protein